MHHLRPSTEFRQSWQYNNIAYLVASTLPEHIYGIPFETFVQERIFDPLGMTETTYTVPRENRSDAFKRRRMDLQACEEDLKENSFSRECLGESVDIGWMPVGEMMAGPGGVVTSARDMVCHPFAHPFLPLTFLHRLSGSKHS
jgi:CubicO group peptidase (beta-lactamase class C family)